MGDFFSSQIIAIKVWRAQSTVRDQEEQSPLLI